MPQQPKVLVTGAGGFIGHHLTNYLAQQISTTQKIKPHSAGS